MKKLILPVLGLFLLQGCSTFKPVAGNFDDAYFVPSDIDKSEVYGKVDPNMFTPTVASSNLRRTRSYGQSYNDRMRNFGGSGISQGFQPTMMMTPMGTSMGMMPFYGYNPYAMNSFGAFNNPFYNPYMFGYNPYCGFYNPDWYYWNQYYSPYNQFYFQGTGRVNNNNNNNWSGSTWGNSSTSKPTFSNSGPRRSSYNSTLPSSNRSSSSGSSWSSGSSSSSSSSGNTYYRPSSTQSNPSSGSTYSRPSSSGPSQSTGGGQTGGSGRRR